MWEHLYFRDLVENLAICMNQDARCLVSFMAPEFWLVLLLGRKCRKNGAYHGVPLIVLLNKLGWKEMPYLGSSLARSPDLDH